MNKVFLMFFSLFVLSCDKVVDPQPIWGCMDLSACNYNEMASYNDACIYPENYDECCDGIEIDQCGVCGGDNTTCLSLSPYQIYRYDNSECINGDSIEVNYDEYFLSILDFENIVITQPFLTFSYIDSTIEDNIYLDNYYIANNDTIRYLSSINIVDTISNDSIMIELVSQLNNENDGYLCEKSLFKVSSAEIYGSQLAGCCNYNQFSLFNLDCEILDCDGICNGSNQPDCNNDCGGNAIIDDCGICTEGDTGFQYNINKDCEGVCFGTSVLDQYNNCCDFIDLDCDQVCLGDAFEDINGNCCELSNLDDCDICSNFDFLNNSEQWDTLWVDYFSINDINPDYWNIEYWEPGRYNDELQAYTPRSENVFIENGKLVIQALREDYTYVNYFTGEEIPAQYTSARLNTKLKVDFAPKNCGSYQGGEIKVDVRAKLPAGSGSWPAIWLLPTYDVYGQWPSSGEIDIMEYGPGVTGDNVILSSVHTQEYNFNVPGFFESGSTNSEYIDNANSDFLVYSMIWSTESISIYADSQEILSYSNDCNGFTSWPFSESFHLLINLAIGGDLGGTEFDNNVFPQQFYIDYVSVTQNNCYD